MLGPLWQDVAVSKTGQIIGNNFSLTHFAARRKPFGMETTDCDEPDLELLDKVIDIATELGVHPMTVTRWKREGLPESGSTRNFIYLLWKLNRDKIKTS